MVSLGFPPEKGLEMAKGKQIFVKEFDANGELVHDYEPMSEKRYTIRAAHDYLISNGYKALFDNYKLRKLFITTLENGGHRYAIVK